MGLIRNVQRFSRVFVLVLITMVVFVAILLLGIGLSLSSPRNIIYGFVAHLINSSARIAFYSHLAVGGGILFLLVSISIIGIRNTAMKWIGNIAQYAFLESQYEKAAPRKYFFLWVFLFTLIGVVSLQFCFADKAYFVNTYIAEDGFVEYASFGFWMVSFFFFLLGYFRAEKLLRVRMIYLFFIVLAFFCAMEEISWGQRILGFEGPTIITHYNLQHELNFHDIGSISIQENGFFILTSIIFFIIPLLKRKSHYISNFLENIGWPFSGSELLILYLIMIIVWVTVGLTMGTLGFWPLSWKGYYNQCDDEIFELYAAMLFCAEASLDFLSIKIWRTVR